MPFVSHHLDAGCSPPALMALLACGMSRRSVYTSSSLFTKVRGNRSRRRVRESFADITAECCLDADWLSDTRFVTSGSDGVINIMNVDSQKPVKTLV